MDELAIKIKIGDRDYPMRIKAEEEEIIRAAGRMVNEQMKAYKDSFGINDKQDLLAMVAFDCLIEKIRSDEETNKKQLALTERIEGITKKIISSLAS